MELAAISNLRRRLPIIAAAIPLLLLLSAACERAGTRGQQDLEKAVNDKDTARVRTALESGADPNTRVKSNLPPLAVATLRGHTEIAELLIEAGADLDPKCRPNVICKPLPHAAELGNTEMLRVLLSAGANPNSRNPYGDVPLIYALGRKQLATARILLEHGADPNLTNQFGVSPFAGACAMGLAEFVTLALDHGADLEAGGSYKEHESVTPLMMAAAEGHLQVVELLIEAGADAAAEAKPFATAETFARSAGHEDIVALLQPRDR